MARGLPFSSLFYATNSARNTPPPSPTPPAWMWPSCKHPRTQSFRSPSADAKTMASIFLVDSAESSTSFGNSSARTATNHHVDDPASDSMSTESEASDDAAAAEDVADAIVRGLRSDDRLLFEPRAPSSSILEKKPPSLASAQRGALTAQAEKEEARSSFCGGVSVSFESADPYRDFRASMEEMVAAAARGAGGLDWERLEKMLAWYLGANGKDTHPAIVTAFVDLVVCMAAGGCGGTSGSSSRVSSFTLAGSEEPAESSSAGGGHCSSGRR